MTFDIKRSNEIVGKTEYFPERLHILEIGFARIFPPSFKNFRERLSKPAALSIFISFNNFSTKSSVTFEADLKYFDNNFALNLLQIH